MIRFCQLAAASLALVFLIAVPPAQSQAIDAVRTLPDDPSVNLQQSAPSPSTPAIQGQTAEEQLKQQEQQRILGLMATFNTTQNKNALPLSPRQKFQLFFKSTLDPWPFVLTGFVSAIDQAQDDFPEYRQGLKGYAKRYGASYTDYFTGNFFGNAVLPSLLHEDPRYYQKGTGSIGGRALWAAASTGWCKRDNGKWGPNYANISGNLIGSAISNVYYPDSERTVSGTISRGVEVTVEGAIGAELIEFWPDIERHYRKKHAEKIARRAQSAAQLAGPTASNPQN